MPRLRQNLLTGDWVCFSPERAKRPEDFIKSRRLKHVDPEVCLFCPNGPAYPTRIYENNTVFVMHNRYPAFVTEPAIVNDGGNLYDNDKAFGVHEVIIRKSHTEHLPELSVAHWMDLLDIYKERLNCYSPDPRIGYITVFHNHGMEAGSSVAHPHSQLIGSGILPPQISKEIARQKKFFSLHQKCLICRMNEEESKKRIRVIAENDYFIANIPYAACYPYEIFVAPKKHAAHFEHMSEHVERNLATILHKIFGLFGHVLHDPPLNFVIHTKPNSTIIEDHEWHWHIEISPRLEHWGGYEVGTGLIINTLLPERAAAFLRSS